MNFRKLLLVVLFVLCLVVVGFPTLELVNAESNTVVVPDDFSTIQEAVDAATGGDTVFVKRGTYNESVCIDQPISLVGEDPATTKIVGDYRLNGTVVLIRHNNVSVTGFTVQPFAYSSSRKGVHLLHVSHCSVVGNVILNNGVGVWLYGSSENNITSNVINGQNNRSNGILLQHYSNNNWVAYNAVTDGDSGIQIDESDGNTVYNNTIANNSLGMCIISNRNTITGNSVSNQTVGIRLAGSNNVFRENRMSNNTSNFDLLWSIFSDVSSFVNDVDSSNTIDDKPLVYWVNRKDEKVPEDAQVVVLVNCTRITVENLKLSQEKQGIMLVGTTESVIRKNSIDDMSEGILVYFSSNNEIVENVLKFDCSRGIRLLSSYQNIITNNSINNCNKAIFLDSSDENTINNNIIFGNNNFIGIDVDGSNYNKIFSNTISDCKRTALWLWNRASQNVFYLNNFVNNTEHVEKYITDLQQFPINIWDNGTIGNYWDNYNGTDADSNGIGDTPYIIEEHNQDNYPLMEPISWSVLDLISLDEAVKAVSEGTIGQNVLHRRCTGEPVMEPYVHESGVTAYLLWVATNGTLFQAEYPSGNVVGKYLENYNFDYNISSGFYVWDLDYGNGETYWIDATNGTILRLTPQKLPFDDNITDLPTEHLATFTIAIIAIIIVVIYYWHKKTRKQTIVG